MKKKIFLITAIIALLACLFAVSVSAANEVTLVSGEKVDFETVFKVGKSGGVDNVVTGYNTGYGSSSMTDVIFPDYIAGIECNGLFGKYVNPASTTIKTLTFEASDEFFISGDNIFSGIPVTKVTFNPNCVVEIRKGSFAGCTSLTEITFPKFRKIAKSSFANCSNMVATNELVFENGITEIGGLAFDGCILLTGTVSFPASIQSINEAAFRKTGFTSFDLSKCVNLTSVGAGGAGGPFNNNDSITSLDLSGCTSLTSLNSNFAADCDKLTKVVLPPNLETIPYKAFAHCYKLQSIVLPASVTYVADEAFHSARSGQDIKTFTVYVQSDVRFHQTNTFRDSRANIEYVLIGDDVTAQSFVAANTFSGITGATVVDYLDKASPWTYTVGQTIANHTIIENYCKALALTGEHNSDDNPCVINCGACGLTSLKENPQHTVSISYNYEGGFDKAGIKLATCTNPGCGHEEASSVEAIFVCLGYSNPIDDRGELTIGFTVDKDAIAEYETANNEKISYGVFAVLKDRIGDQDIFAEDGSPLSETISAELTNHSIVAFELRLLGFEGELRDIELAMGAYVYDCKENKYSYLQFEAPNEGCKYHFSSYNEIVG